MLTGAVRIEMALRDRPVRLERPATGDSIVWLGYRLVILAGVRLLHGLLRLIDSLVRLLHGLLRLIDSLVRLIGNGLGDRRVVVIATSHEGEPRRAHPGASRCLQQASPVHPATLYPVPVVSLGHVHARFHQYYRPPSTSAAGPPKIILHFYRTPLMGQVESTIFMRSRSRSASRPHRLQDHPGGDEIRELGVGQAPQIAEDGQVVLSQQRPRFDPWLYAGELPAEDGMFPDPHLRMARMTLPLDGIRVAETAPSRKPASRRGR